MTVTRPETLGSNTTVVPRMLESSSTMSRSSALFIASCHFSSSASSAPGESVTTMATKKNTGRSTREPRKVLINLITLSARQASVKNAKEHWVFAALRGG